MAVTINGDTGIDKVVDNTIATADLQDGAVTAAKIASGAIPNSYAGMKNRIINGNMAIDQRNAGASKVVALSVYNSIDRFISNIESTFYNITTIQQNLDSLIAPNYFTNYVGIQVDTGTALTGNNFYNFRQQIEGNNVSDLSFGTSNAKTITISFWVRSTLTGDFSFSLRNGATDRSYVTTYNISSANTWEKKTVTIAGDTIGTWLTNNGIGLTVNWALGNSSGAFSTSTLNEWIAGSFTGATTSVDLVETTGAKWYITGVQLEVGTTATDFENLQYGQQLALCQRYFERYNGGVDGGIPQGVARTDLGNRPETNLFYLEKRANPTITGDSTVNFNTMANTNAVTTSGPHSFVGTGPRGANLFYYTASGVVAGALSGIGLIVLNGASDYINIDAEL